MENYHVVMKVKLKTRRTAISGPHERGTDMFTFAGIRTSTTSLTITFLSTTDGRLICLAATVGKFIT